MRRHCAALIAVLVLGGCATPSQDLIVLLPDKQCALFIRDTLGTMHNLVLTGVERLRADGHDVMLVAEMRSGMPDTDVLKLAIPKPAFWSPRIGTLAS